MDKMDLIESIKKDKAYQKCKLIVKTWEKDFKSQYSRTPSKFDIKEAPSKIKYAYKKYFNLKSAALENSLIVCDFDEEIFVSSEVIVPETIQPLESLTCESQNPNVEEMLPSLPSGQELEKLLSISKVENEIRMLNPISESVSKKLSQNRKFSLRNPRKISLLKSQSIPDETITDKENSDIMVFEKAKDGKDSIQMDDDLISQHDKPLSVFLKDSVSSMKIQSVRQLDAAWLERATGFNTQNKETNHLDDKLDDNMKFGIRNICVPQLKDKGLDVVENSESEEEDVSINKLKPALKKRKINNHTMSTVTNRHKESDCINDANLNQNTIILKKVKVSKSISDDNQLPKRKSNCYNKQDNIQNLQPPDITEYLPFGLERDIAPRHMKVTNILKNKDAEIKTTNNPTSSGIEKLENKIKSGTLNENFVKINIEKKVFVRGKKSINFSKYKKQQWKDKKALHGGMEFPESGKISCFKCGGTGHMARYCTSQKGDVLLPLENVNEGEVPTLDDMKKFASQETNNTISLTEQLSVSVDKSSQIPEAFLKMLAVTSSNSDDNVKPIYSNPEQTSLEELHEVLKKFGYSSFRPGQEQAIKRILCGLSTLLILSTGGGKSLCYQVPAYIYSIHFKCITLIISPLVSLMEDQVLNMPDFLKAGCLHNNQPPTQRQKIVQYLKDGEISVLLISPEALISGDTSNGFAGLFKSLPPIAFACIDEAHCVSQWSHNFRPSYLMICRVLREKLNVKCILGLTATASQSTIKSIISHINIPDDINGVITNPTLPDNLALSVSFEKNKDRALVSFLNLERIKYFNSIIVYCIRRDECERVAAILRSCLQEKGKINMEQQNKKRKRMSYIAEAYHAGMSAAQRKKIQNNFMNGTLRIIVATVAFGMGINKSNIRCIVHYNMPSSFESYIQEVGRAGRDGEPAVCHVLMNNSNSDKNELLKHIHSNSIDRPTIRKLLQKVFIPCECIITPQASSNLNAYCTGHEVGIPIESTIEELDLPSENIATLLCYVELHPNQYIKVLNNAYTMCKICSYGGPQKITEAAKSCRPLAMAYLLESQMNPEVMMKSILEFNVIEVAAAIGWESGMTKYQLKNLEWVTENGKSKRSQLKIEFNTLGFRIKSRGDLNASELDNILDDLHNTVQSQEKASLFQLEESSRAFNKLANCSIEDSDWSEEVMVQKSNELKHIIRNYFQREEILPQNITLEERPLEPERIISDVRSLISSYKDCSFTGRSIARIFQGISSPNYPAIVWGRCKFWRSHIHEDFHGICKLATQQIIQMKM